MNEGSLFQILNPKLYQELNTNISKEYAELHAKRLSTLILLFILLEIIMTIVSCLIDTNKCFPMGATVLVLFLIGAAIITHIGNKEIIRLNSFEYRDNNKLEAVSIRKIKSTSIIVLVTLIAMILGPLLILLI